MGRHHIHGAPQDSELRTLEEDIPRKKDIETKVEIKT
jgi:hypothetical protein